MSRGETDSAFAGKKWFGSCAQEGRVAIHQVTEKNMFIIKHPQLGPGPGPGLGPGKTARVKVG